MPDTIRQRSALLALLADNVTGDISAQDLRDVLVSLLGCYGQIQLDSGAVSQAVNTTPVKLTGFNANGSQVGVVADHTADSLTIVTAGCYHVAFSAAYTADSTASTHGFVLRKNGVAVSGMRTRTRLANTEVHCVAFVGLVDLIANDVLTIFVDADAARNLTLVDAQFSARMVG